MVVLVVLVEQLEQLEPVSYVSVGSDFYLDAGSPPLVFQPIPSQQS
jgi:hypothetical protein